MVSASTQMVRSAVNVPSDTTWITLESNVLVRWHLKLKFNIFLWLIQLIKKWRKYLKYLSAVEQKSKVNDFLLWPLGVFIAMSKLSLIALSPVSLLFFRHWWVLHRKPMWKWNLHQCGGRFRVFLPGGLRTWTHDDLWRSDTNTLAQVLLII